MGRTTFHALTAIVLGAVLACAVLTAQSQPTTAWTNGRWFDGTRFVRRDVYSRGDRLTLRRSARVDRTVDLAGGYATGAFGEAHTHQVTSGDADASIRTYLRQGIFYVMSQAKPPDARPRRLREEVAPTGVRPHHRGRPMHLQVVLVLDSSVTRSIARMGCNSMQLRDRPI